VIPIDDSHIVVVGIGHDYKECRSMRT